MHSVPVPINVRCYSNGDVIVWRSEVTLRARKRRRLGREASRYAAGRQVCIPPFEQVDDAEGHGVVLAAVAEQVEYRETIGSQAMNVSACLIT
jgi:hypothetical protein